MRSIIKVFGRSPFIPLQMHMEKVAECVGVIGEVLSAYRRQESKTVESLAEKISTLEHEADILKHDIRNSLPRGLFTAVDRSSLLRILDLQDKIANRAENYAVLLTFKQATSFPELDEAFDEFLANCLGTFNCARDVVNRLDKLIETGFGGAEAEKVNKLIDEVARLEHEADVSQRELLRLLLANEEKISHGDFFLWSRIILQIGGIADRSDNLAAAIRATLESK